MQFLQGPLPPTDEFKNRNDDVAGFAAKAPDDPVSGVLLRGYGKLMPQWTQL